MQLYWQDELFWFGAAFILPALLAVRILSDPRSRAEIAYGCLLVTQCLWILGQALELCLVGINSKLWADGLQYLPMLAASMLQLAFAHEFVGKPAPRGLYALYTLLGLPTSIYYVLAPLHGLTRADAHIIHGLPFDTLHYEFTAGDAILILLLLGGGFYANAVVLRYLGKVRRAHFRNLAPIVAGFLLPTLIGTLAFFLEFRILGQRDVSFAVFGLSGLCVFWGIRHRRAVVSVPIARDRVFDRVPDAALVLNGANAVLEMNQAAAGLLGLTEDHVGRVLSPGEIPNSQISVAKLLAVHEGQVATLADKSEERAFAVEHHPWPDIDAKLFLVRDVTEQETARRILEKRGSQLQQSVEEGSRMLVLSERKFQALFDNAEHLSGLLDREGRVLAANRAALSLLGVSLAEVTGLHFWETGWWTHDAVLKQKVRDAVVRAAKGEIVRFEATHLGKDGVLRIVDFSLKAIFDADGTVTMLLPEGRDITDLRHAEEQLKQAQKMESLGRLAGGVAHDFNNLLMVISANLELATEEIPDEETRLSLKQARDAASTAAALTQQLLAFSRQSRLSRRDILVTSELERLIGMLSRILPATITIQLENHAPEARVSFDDAQLQQVLLNLAINARDAMPEGGTLKFSVRAVRKATRSRGLSADWIQLEVTDSGLGIAADALEKIFEPFYTTKGVGRGTGLGLAMVYGALAQNGGFVEVQSTVGEGTCFSLYLPPAVTEPSLEAQPSREIVTPPPQGTLVYVVDDEDAVRSTVCRLLRRAGLVAVGFASAEKFREAMPTLAPPALILSDSIMPKMTGYELLPFVRRRWPHVPVVLMSGYTEEGFAKETLAAPDAFLKKPFASQDLMATLTEALRHNRLPVPPAGDN